MTAGLIASRNRETGCSHISVLQKSDMTYICNLCNREVEKSEWHIEVQTYHPEGIIYIMSR